jgi:hypothetical protein
MKYLNTLLILSIIGYLLFFNEPSFGGVRGGARTGFQLMDGESIAISSSTTGFDFVIEPDTATSTFYMGSDDVGTSTHCIILLDQTQLNYCKASNGVFSCSTSTPCN